MSYRIGIDLGGTNIGIGMLDGQRRILAEDSIPTGIPCSPKELAARIAGQVSLLLKRQSVSSDQIEAAGIGIPGTVDPGLGVVEYANNLDFVRFGICWRPISLFLSTQSMMQRRLPGGNT